MRGMHPRSSAIRIETLHDLELSAQQSVDDVLQAFKILRRQAPVLAEPALCDAVHERTDSHDGCADTWGRMAYDPHENS